MCVSASQVGKRNARVWCPGTRALPASRGRSPCLMVEVSRFGVYVYHILHLIHLIKYILYEYIYYTHHILHIIFVCICMTFYMCVSAYQVGKRYARAWCPGTRVLPASRGRSPCLKVQGLEREKPWQSTETCRRRAPEALNPLIRRRAVDS